MLPKINESTPEKSRSRRYSRNYQEQSSTNIYSPTSKQKGVSFCKADRNINPIRDPNSPGPANYQTLQPKNEKSISFTKSIKDKKQQKFVTPGPGSYENDIKSKQKKNQFTFQGKYQPDEHMITPGPGDYELILEDKAIRQKFGQFPRFCGQTVVSPGPGDYQIQKTTLIKSRSVKSVLKQNKKFEITPGPGDYQTNIEGHNSMHRNKGLTIMGKYNPKVENSTTFAFNKYFEKGFPTELIKTKSKAFSIGKSERLQGPKNETPGPSSYDNLGHSLIKFQGGVFTQSKYSSKNQVSPGPGQYEKEDNHKKSLGFTIQRSTSIPSLYSSKQKTPGVGSYNIGQTTLKKSSKTNNSIFTKSKRHQLVANNNVGVGSYNIK